MKYVQELLSFIGWETDEKPLDAVAEKLEHIEHKLEFLAAAELIKGIFELTERFAGFAEQLANGAAAAGLTVEAFQELSFAASQSGVKTDEMSGAMARLSRTLFEARAGSAEAVKTFEEAGISQADIARFKTGADAMKALSARMQGMHDPVAKQALAMKLLGRGSYTMVNFLSKGPAAMDKLGKSATKMGAVLTHHEVEALERAEHATGSLWLVIKTTAAGIAATFAPIIEVVAGSLAKFLGANRKIIQLNMYKWALKLAYIFGYLEGLFEKVTGKLIAFAKAHPKLVTNLGLLGMSLGGVGVAAGAGSRGIKTAHSAIKALEGPVGLTIKALTGLKNTLGIVLEKMALASADKFPKFAEQLWKIGGALRGTSLAGLLGVVGMYALAAAGVALVVAGFVTLWQLATGKAWRDTALGKFISWLAEKMHKLGVELGIVEEYSDEDQGPPAPEQLGHWEGKGKNRKFVRDQITQEGPAAPTVTGPALAARMAAASGVASDASTNINSLEGMSAPPVGGGSAMDPGGRMAPDVHYETTVNNTFNVGPNLPPKEAAAAVERGAEKAVTRAHANAARALKPVEHY